MVRDPLAAVTKAAPLQFGLAVPLYAIEILGPIIALAYFSVACRFHSRYIVNE
jgi:hypothetical protein